MATPSAGPTLNASPRLRTHRAGWIALLVILTFITFGQVVFCDFTNWDDTYTVANDPGLNRPTWRALGHHWTHADMDIYMPATQTVWAGIAYFARTASPDSSGVSLNPYAFHLVNLLVHLLAVLIAFSLLQALGFAPGAAAIGAALFAVHPVQVEPVAWVSGLKDLLCGMFCLAAFGFGSHQCPAPIGQLFGTSLHAYLQCWRCCPNPVGWFCRCWPSRC